MALRCILITDATTHPVMRNFLKKQWPATMHAMTICRCLWLASIAVPTIPQNVLVQCICMGEPHLPQVPVDRKLRLVAFQIFLVVVKILCIDHKYGYVSAHHLPFLAKRTFPVTVPVSFPSLDDHCHHDKLELPCIHSFR